MDTEKLTISLEPQYIDREFQERIARFVLENDIKKKIIVVDAPTGAGKTHSFKSLKYSNGITFLVLPNNYLIEEKYYEFKSKNLIGERYLKKLNRKVLDETITENRLGDTTDPRALIEAIELISSESKLIITNPSIIFLILYNHYWKRYHEKGSHLVQLIEDGLVNILFDEVHLYNRDQRNRILAINSLLSQNVKFGYTSATIPPDLLPSLYQIFGKDAIEYVKVTTTERKDSANLLRGPLEVELFNSDVLGLSEGTLDRLKEGNWIIILNNIISINKFYKNLLLRGIPQSDILLVSGYHDKNNSSLDMFKEGKSRIVIASNIIEQGINPPKNYLNFIIEPGYYHYNFIQRIGRVGRGIEDNSNILIPINTKVLPDNIGVVTDFNDFIERMKFMFRREDESSIDLKSLGYYIGNLISRTRFDNDHRNKFIDIIQELKGSDEILKGINNFDILEYNILNKKLDSCFSISPSFLERLERWWKSYDKTFRYFIRKDSIVEAIDESLKMEDSSPLELEYNELWININKYIKSIEDGKYIVGEDREKPFKDFMVSLINVPFEEYGPFPYKNIQWHERSIIKECLSSHRDKFVQCRRSNGAHIYQLLEEYLYATGWPERLLYRVHEDHYESRGDKGNRC